MNRFVLLINLTAVLTNGVNAGMKFEAGNTGTGLAWLAAAAGIALLTVASPALRKS